MGIYFSSTNDIDILNEVYFGQTPGITRVFEAFSAFRQKYVNDRKLFMNLNPTIINAQNDKLLGKFISEVEREFGFYSVMIGMDMSDNNNMCTIIPMTGIEKDPKKAVSYSKTGYRFKPETKASVYIVFYAGLLFRDSMNDRETFGIFLHEIGHNFQNYMTSNMQTLSVANSLMKIWDIILNILTNPTKALSYGSALLITNNTVLGLINKVEKELSVGSGKEVGALSYINYYRSFAKNTRMTISSITRLLGPVNIGIKLFSVLKRYITTFLNPIGSMYGYTGEQLADSFPAMYGFGKDMSTALLKLDQTTNKTGLTGVINNIPFLGHYYSLVDLPILALVFAFDPHPIASARIKKVIDQMKYDLKDPNIPPKLRKQLEEEIKETEKEIDTILEKSSKIENPNFAFNLYLKFLYTKCGGDPKYVLSKSFFNHEEEINKRYYDNVENESASAISNVTLL